MREGEGGEVVRVRVKKMKKVRGVRWWSGEEGNKWDESGCVNGIGMYVLFFFCWGLEREVGG